MKSFYQPQVDGLRFLAFLMVYFCHNPRFLPLIPFNGTFGLGVDLFFCISAYLITRLLLLEEESSGKINLVFFYIRRSLRIWPLYFFVILLLFFAVPFLPFEQRWMPIFGSAEYQAKLSMWLLPLTFFYENYAVVHNMDHPSTFVSHLWTISVEEQFYLFWPIVFLFFKKVRTSLKGISIFIFLLFIVAICYRYYLYTSHSNSIRLALDTIARMDSFLVGILIAIGVHTKTISPNLCSPWLFPIGAFILAKFENDAVYANPLQMEGVWANTKVCIGAGLIVLSIVGGTNILTKIFVNPKLIYLGKISYGLYVFHIPVLFVHNLTVAKLYAGTPDLAPYLNFFVPLILLFGLCILSYEYFEKPFLKLKDRYAVIRSRPVDA